MKSLKLITKFDRIFNQWSTAKVIPEEEINIEKLHSKKDLISINGIKNLKIKNDNIGKFDILHFIIK